MRMIKTVYHSTNSKSTKKGDKTGNKLSAADSTCDKLALSIHDKKLYRRLKIIQGISGAIIVAVFVAAIWLPNTKVAINSCAMVIALASGCGILAPGIARADITYRQNNPSDGGGGI